MKPPWLECLVGGGLLCLGLFVLSPVNAGLFDDNEARKAILDLRDKSEDQKAAINSLNTSLAKQSGQASANTQEIKQLRQGLLDLANQLEALRADLATQRGQSEELTKAVQEVQGWQKEAKGLLEKHSEQAVNSPAELPKVSVDGLEFHAGMEETNGFQDALATFRKADYSAAQNRWKEFLGRYPQSGYAPSALFWLGSSQYALGFYKEAMVSLRNFQKTAPPGHARLPNALLAIAGCQTELNSSQAAKKTLQEVIALYPSSDAAVAARKKLLRLR